MPVKNHNYLMALAMNSDVCVLQLKNADIPVKITEVESESSASASPMTTFKCLVVNDDQIKYHTKNLLNSFYGAKPEWAQYAASDVIATARAHDMLMAAKRFEIKRVYFNKPVTVVLWADGTKTIVRCQDGDAYSEETGLAMCFAKKALGNKGAFNDVFKKFVPDYVKDKSEATDEMPEL